LCAPTPQQVIEDQTKLKKKKFKEEKREKEKIELEKARKGELIMKSL